MNLKKTLWILAVACLLSATTPFAGGLVSDSMAILTG
jgi:hypothetical protein